MQTNPIPKITSEALWARDIQTSKMWFNEGWQTVFGYSKEEIATFEDWLCRIHPDDVDIVRIKLETALHLSTCRDYRNEYRFLKADGNYAYVVAKGNILRDNDGQAYFISGATQDVTEFWQRLNEIKELTSLRMASMEEALQEIRKNLNDDVIQIVTAVKLLLEAGLQSPELLEISSRMSLESIELALKKINVLDKKYQRALAQL